MNPKLPWMIAVSVAGASFGMSAVAAADQSHAGTAATPACLTPAAWITLGGERPRLGSVTAILAAMAKRDVVLLGEQHDEDDHHRWQVQTLAALHALRPNMLIGFEMFPRRMQPALDRWVAGELTVKQLLQQSEWDEVWNMPADLYLPLFQFARINRIPMVALNIDHKLIQAIADKGWDAVAQEAREGVSRAAAPAEAYRDFLFEIYREHARLRGKDGAQVRKSDPAFRHFVDSQTTWDRAMAQALARRVIAGPAGEKPLVVGVMGTGHLRFGYGVPHQLRDLGVSNIGTLLPLPAGFDCKDLRSGLADAAFALPEQASAKPEPPRLGVRLEGNAGKVNIAEVTAGSLAERSGLKAGDRLLAVAGSPATRVTPVIATVRRQPAGTWLPIRVMRGNDTLELVIKFPATP